MLLETTGNSVSLLPVHDQPPGVAAPTNQNEVGSSPVVTVLFATPIVFVF